MFCTDNWLNVCRIGISKMGSSSRLGIPRSASICKWFRNWFVFLLCCYLLVNISFFVLSLLFVICKWTCCFIWLILGRIIGRILRSEYKSFIFDFSPLLFGHCFDIIRSIVSSNFDTNPIIAAGLLRLHFHYCFVRGYANSDQTVRVKANYCDCYIFR